MTKRTGPQTTKSVQKPGGHWTMSPVTEVCLGLGTKITSDHSLGSNDYFVKVRKT